MSEDLKIIDEVTSGEYKWGFVSNIESENAPKGLSEDIVRFISAKKKEPEWMLEFRLKAFRHWQKMQEPQWANVNYPKVDFQDIIYYSAPKPKKQLNSLDELDPEIKATFDKLGISLLEQKRLAGVAVDAVIDSVSVKTTFRQELSKLGIIFSSFSLSIKAKGNKLSAPAIKPVSCFNSLVPECLGCKSKGSVLPAGIPQPASSG